MARPKKDSNCVEARQRIIDGFWVLLETHRLRDITVGMVVEQARCNRGTFYYHYSDIDDLVYAAIEHELIVERDIPGVIFDTVCGLTTSPSQAIDESQQLYRLSLIMEQGGMDLVTSKVRDVVRNLWISVLAPDEGTLSESVSIIVEYYTSGILGTILYRFSEQRNGSEPLSCPKMDQFIQANTTFIVNQIAQAQGMSEEEILARLHTASCITRQLRSSSHAEQKHMPDKDTHKEARLSSHVA